MELDTHDSVGVVDARDILTQDQIDFTTNELYRIGVNVKKKHPSAEYRNLDIYKSIQLSIQLLETMLNDTSCHG